MHIFFSGIGGTGIGPLALIARRAGYSVSGSDEKDSGYIQYLKKSGITDISIGQSRQQIAEAHDARPIDWYVHSSALPKDHPELEFCRAMGIKVTKRDELINKIVTDANLKLIAIAGTHGKTTTTAMMIWLLKQLEIPVSYSVGAKISFGDMGEFDAKSEYFIYEGDEFDRNFLAFSPYMALITGVSWDHHEIYPTQEDYNSAFRQFLNQSNHKILWQTDAERLGVHSGSSVVILNEADPQIEKVELLGLYNRRDAYLVARALQPLTNEPLPKLLECLSNFPGISRRFEEIKSGLYSDYAHTPEKIIAAMNVAQEATRKSGQKIVVIYEPLTNQRMHHTAHQHADIFTGASKIYWVPSYLAREDPSLSILTPDELIKSLNPQLQQMAEPAELDDRLNQTIHDYLDRGDMVLAFSGGGGGSLDEWLRRNFGSQA